MPVKDMTNHSGPHSEAVV